MNPHQTQSQVQVSLAEDAWAGAEPAVSKCQKKNEPCLRAERSFNELFMPSSREPHQYGQKLRTVPKCMLKPVAAVPRHLAG